MSRHLFKILCLLIGACWGKDAYIVEGTVLEVTGPAEIIVDHDEVPGLMGAMIMPFRVADPTMLTALKPGDRIVGRLMIRREGSELDKLRVIGHPGVPSDYRVSGPGPIKAGDPLPPLEVAVTGGETWTLGVGQGVPTVVTWLYTTCPIPEYCPAVVMRLQALQAQVAGKARILAITIDPEGDTPEVLEQFATSAGADPTTWRFGRLSKDDLMTSAKRATLSVREDEGEVLHGLRLMVLDADGRLIERYDDNRWPLDRVVSQLTTGGPAAPPGSDGTITPR